MNRCLGERALVDLHLGEGTAPARAHLLMCTGCRSRYDRLAADLHAIHDVLTAPPPAALRTRPMPHLWGGWLPAGAVSAAVLGTILAVIGLRQSVPLQIASHDGTVSTFAADVSTAVFTSPGSDEVVEIASEAPYLRSDLGSEWPCSGDGYLNGECNDQLSALFVESD
jgi:hypothetical protein